MCPSRSSACSEQVTAQDAKKFWLQVARFRCSACCAALHCDPHRKPGTRRDDGLQGLLLSEHVLTTVPPVADFSRDPVRDTTSHRPAHHIVPTP